MAPTTPPRPQRPDNPAPEEPGAPDLDEPDSRDDEALDALVDDIAASAPLDREAIIEVEAALSYVHERLDGDGDALAVLGLALDRIAERHATVLRHVARAVASLQTERRCGLFGPPSGVMRAVEGP